MGVAQCLIIVAMLVLNSAFAAYELALASISAGRLKLLAEKHARGAASALRMKNRMEASLAVVQIGITLVGAIAAATGGAGAEGRFSPWLERSLELSPGLADVLAIALVVLPLSAVTIVFGELVPKTFALRHSEWVCLNLSLLMRAFSFPVFPAVVCFEWITRRLVGLLSRNVMASNDWGDGEPGLNELRAQASMLRTSRIIGARQEQMILGASRLSSIKVSDIMVPDEDIVMLFADGPLTEQLVTVHIDVHTRFPVTERRNDPQAIIGYANVKELFFLAKTHPENPSVREILRPLLPLAAESLVGEAFTRMMSEHVHLALVRHGDGTVAGILSLEDILEEVVGDIQDEFDRLPRHITASGRQWIVGGGAPLSRVREVLNRSDLAPNQPGSASLCEWLQVHHGVQPRTGMAYQIEGVRLLARKVRRHKLVEALVAAAPPASDAHERPAPAMEEPARRG
ncbi:MAG: HlyC/CorC family transporter [Phycisphaerales bacterium]|nr:HlyC/CorC family transporter [Phycisphaerales bacterium]